MKEIEIASPAKINLFLEITGKRADGYHNLQTLFAKTDFADTLLLQKTAGGAGIKLELVNESKCPLSAGKNNLAVKAAELFFKNFKINAGARLKLIKRVPIGAGLGGGSSNAAAVLRGLCEIFPVERNPKKNPLLLKTASALGADVPFFLHDETFCTAQGIGDILTPLGVSAPAVFVVLAYPGVPSPTAQAYARLKIPSDKDVLTSAVSLHKLKLYLEKGAPLSQWSGHIFNRLEGAVLPFIERTANLRKVFADIGADAVLMSGSGSTVFALTDDKEKALYMSRSVSSVYPDGTTMLARFL